MSDIVNPLIFGVVLYDALDLNARIKYVCFGKMEKMCFTNVWAQDDIQSEEL